MAFLLSRRHVFYIRLMDDKKIKDLVRSRYGQIVNNTSCCGGGCCSSSDIRFTMNEDYSNLKGYESIADFGLGCGLPTEFASLREGDTVIDLGSGAGNDCFVARAYTGKSGRVIGIDFTPEMTDKAKQNASKLGYSNVEFHTGDIENMPVPDQVADVVISNCVLNLLPSKEKIFHEIFRVLKPGGHFCISDVVLNGELPADLKENVEFYTGCIAGAIQKDRYLEYITRAGFIHIAVQKENQIVLPESVADQSEVTFSVLSVTVTGEKPLSDK